MVLTYTPRYRQKAPPSNRFISDSEIKIGIVGRDSSHVVQFTTLLHHQTLPPHVAGARIVAADAGGSMDWELSYLRLPGFRDQTQNEFGVPGLASIAAVVAAEGPWPLFSDLSGWAFYAVHHIEVLFALMGRGGQRASCEGDEANEIITGHWPDGRGGTITTQRNEELSFAAEVDGGRRCATVGT